MGIAGQVNQDVAQGAVHQPGRHLLAIDLLVLLDFGQRHFQFIQLVIAGFVTIVDLLLQAYVPALSASLGVFIPLIVVNCIIIGRAEAFCQKNPVGPSFFDGIFQGLGYTLVLIAMCVIRELLGKGSFGTGIINTIDGVIGTGNGIQIFPSEYGALVLTLPIGGFITLGCLIALMQYALRKSAEKKEAKEKALAAQEKEAA